MLEECSSKLAAKFQAHFTEQNQVFDVRLFEGKQKWLDQPSDLQPS